MYIDDKIKNRKAYKHKAKIAIIGAGPAGMTAAKTLASLGDYDLKVYEKYSRPGGLLMYGIPEFRLKKTTVYKHVIDLSRKGVSFRCNCQIGKDKTFKDLLNDGCDAIFLGLGCRVPSVIPAIDLKIPGVHQAIELLKDAQDLINHKKTLQESFINKGDKVVIIGGGNVALDAARTASRCGAASVTVLYRKNREHMTCYDREYNAAVKDGVQFEFAGTPKAVLGTEKVQGLEYEKRIVFEDGKTQETGEYKTLDADVILLAVGFNVGTEALSPFPGILVDEQNKVLVKNDLYYGMSSVEGIFAAGDLVHGAKSIALANQEAKKTAIAMHAFIEEKKSLLFSNAAVC